MHLFERGFPAPTFLSPSFSLVENAIWLRWRALLEVSPTAEKIQPSLRRRIKWKGVRLGNFRRGIQRKKIPDSPLPGPENVCTVQWVATSLRIGPFYTKTRGLHSRISRALRAKIYLRIGPLSNIYKANTSAYLEFCSLSLFRL
jgi:hypothetical protein